jgi:hypothetical protein
LGIHFNFYKENKTFENVREKLKIDEEYLKFIGIQGFNLYWLNNCCKHISPPPFDSDSCSTTKPPVYYLKFIGIQGFNIYWPNNCCKHISPPPFDSDSYSTTKPPVEIVKEIQNFFYQFL